MTRFLPLLVLLPLGLLGIVVAWWSGTATMEPRAAARAAVALPPSPLACLRMAGFTAEGAAPEYGDLGAPAVRRARC